MSLPSERFLVRLKIRNFQITDEPTRINLSSERGYLRNRSATIDVNFRREDNLLDITTLDRNDSIDWDNPIADIIVVYADEDETAQLDLVCWVRQ